jgi:hypothetical protein
MRTFIFRLARKDGKQHLGELLNIEVKSGGYAVAAEEIASRYPDHYIVGYTVS